MSQVPLKMVDWKRVRELSEEWIPKIEIKVGQLLTHESGIGYRVVTDGKCLFIILELWHKAVDKNRAVAVNPARYCKLTEKEKAQINKLLGELAPFLPDLEFGKNYIYNLGIFSITLRPAQFPQLSSPVKSEKGPTKMRGEKNNDIKHRLDQLFFRRPDLVLTFEDDIPKIAKEIGVSIEDIKKYISARGTRKRRGYS